MEGGTVYMVTDATSSKHEIATVNLGTGQMAYVTGDRPVIPVIVEGDVRKVDA